MTETLTVSLGTDQVGSLELTRAGERVFRFDPTYETTPQRRVLGQWFEDQDRTVPITGREALPAFFANLLPQGELRKYLAGKLELRDGQDFHLLAALGGDLPGAVRVAAPAAMRVATARDEVSRRPKTRPRVDEEHYFSLAGMQLKFTMVEAGDGLTLPSKTGDGRYIVKLPDLRRPGVPETEFSMIEWARASGIDTVDARLEPLERIKLAYDELPSLASSTALAVRRFDRVDAGRLHQEDFAQVLGVEPDDKYAQNDRSLRRRAHRTETLMAILAAVAPESVEDAIRRVVFSLVSGNEDVHLKNWSLVYDSEGVRATLSPAYDLVCTVAFTTNRDPKLALSLGGIRAMGEVTLPAFHDLAKTLGESTSAMDARVTDDVTRILDAKASHQREWPLPPDVRKSLDRHIARLPVRAPAARRPRIR